MAEKTGETSTVERSPKRKRWHDANSLLNTAHGKASEEEMKHWENRGFVPQSPQEKKESLTPEPVSAVSPNTSPLIKQEDPNIPIPKPNILTRALSKFISRLRW